MSETVPSPCTGVCRIAPADGLCEGCARSIEEIIAWPTLDNAGKRAMWETLRKRRG